MARWFVDGMNVIGSRPSGWWRDRHKAMRELAAELEDFSARRGEEVSVVFDGSGPSEPVEAGEVRVLFAPGGPDSADDVIVAELDRDPAPEEVTVATSDSRLAGRARAIGATVVGGGEFRRMLEE